MTVAVSSFRAVSVFVRAFDGLRPTALKLGSETVWRSERGVRGVSAQFRSRGRTTLKSPEEAEPTAAASANDVRASVLRISLP